MRASHARGYFCEPEVLLVAINSPSCPKYILPLSCIDSVLCDNFVHRAQLQRLLQATKACSIRICCRQVHLVTLRFCAQSRTSQHNRLPKCQRINDTSLIARDFANPLTTTRTKGYRQKRNRYCVLCSMPGLQRRRPRQPAAAEEGKTEVPRSGRGAAGAEGRA